MADYRAFDSKMRDMRIADTKTCCCIGPQNGEPLCPCLMKNVQIIDGRYKQVIDYGPAIRLGKFEQTTEQDDAK